jgi:hypothetical protein
MNIYFLETPIHYQNLPRPVEMVSVPVSIGKAFCWRFLGSCTSVTKFEETLQDGSCKILKEGHSGIGKKLADDLSVARRWRAIAS